jgi:hypothetical protein
VNTLKELYQVAEMDVINFSLEDVIATSLETEPSTTLFIPPSGDDNTLEELDPLD